MQSQAYCRADPTHLKVTYDQRVDALVWDDGPARRRFLDKAIHKFEEDLDALLSRGPEAVEQWKKDWRKIYAFGDAEEGGGADQVGEPDDAGSGRASA